VLFLAELFTILDVRGFLSWHVVIGVLLIPPALLKTGTTGWRIVRYYTGNGPYRAAGPPPMLLRLLGPLVILSTLAVLGTGLALILINPQSGRDGLVSVGSFAVSPLFLHKASFVVWAAATGLHTLGRLIPALRLTVIPALSRHVPGRLSRTLALSVTVVVAIIVSILALSAAGPWRTADRFDRPDRPGHFRTR
jgi:hypothetical protein